ncbi:hypothetical protein MTO96_021669 [Rhipicephalus appendiculatus]
MSVRRPIVLNVEDAVLGTPEEDRNCEPRCKLCEGRRHLTADKHCRQRYQIPYVVRVRRQERAKAELAAEQEAAEAAQLTTFSQRPRGCSHSRSRSRSRRRSSSGTQAPRSRSVSIGGGGGAPGGRTTWADKVKGGNQHRPNA